MVRHNLPRRERERPQSDLSRQTNVIIYSIIFDSCVLFTMCFLSFVCVCGCGCLFAPLTRDRFIILDCFNPVQRQWCMSRVATSLCLVVTSAVQGWRYYHYNSRQFNCFQQLITLQRSDEKCLQPQLVDRWPATMSLRLSAA